MNEQVRDNRGQWFVVHTLSGHENKVRDTINRQLRMGDQVGVYEAFIPVEKIEEVRMRERKVRSRKFFPGYILVRMDLYDEEGRINEKAWYFVRGVQGVLGFLGGANRPTALSQDDVDYIMRPVTSSKVKGNYKVGEIVRIKDGAFENFEGNVQSVDEERGKLQILVTILGHLTPVELEFWQVERVV